MGIIINKADLAEALWSFRSVGKTDSAKNMENYDIDNHHEQ